MTRVRVEPVAAALAALIVVSGVTGGEEQVGTVAAAVVQAAVGRGWAARCNGGNGFVIWVLFADNILH